MGQSSQGRNSESLMLSLSCGIYTNLYGQVFLFCECICHVLTLFPYYPIESNSQIFKKKCFTIKKPRDDFTLYWVVVRTDVEN